VTFLCVSYLRYHMFATAPPLHRLRLGLEELDSWTLPARHGGHGVRALFCHSTADTDITQILICTFESWRIQYLMLMGSGQGFGGSTDTRNDGPRTRSSSLSLSRLGNWRGEAGSARRVVSGRARGPTESRVCMYPCINGEIRTPALSF